jgi:hypothetical protein
MENRVNFNDPRALVELGSGYAIETRQAPILLVVALDAGTVSIRTGGEGELNGLTPREEEGLVFKRLLPADVDASRLRGWVDREVIPLAEEALAGETTALATFMNEPLDELYGCIPCREEPGVLDLVDADLGPLDLDHLTDDELAAKATALVETARGLGVAILTYGLEAVDLRVAGEQEVAESVLEWLEVEREEQGEAASAE